MDTGADVSVLPRSRSKNSFPSDRRLYATNGTIIFTFGEKRLNLDFSLRQSFTWLFVIADFAQPILGNDFLHNFNLLPDLRGRQLLDATTKLTTPGRVSTIKIFSLKTVDSSNVFQEILRKHLDVTRPPKYTEPRHPVRHHIVTKGPLCTDRVCRLSPERLRYAKKEINAWISDGIISPSSSQYSSAMLMRCKLMDRGKSAVTTANSTG